MTFHPVFIQYRNFSDSTLVTELPELPEWYQLMALQQVILKKKVIDKRIVSTCVAM